MKKMTFRVGDEVIYEGLGPQAYPAWRDSTGIILSNWNRMMKVKWTGGPVLKGRLESYHISTHFPHNLKLLTPKELPYDPAQQPDQEDDV
jgi:hypothetical protein